MSYKFIGETVIINNQTGVIEGYLLYRDVFSVELSDGQHIEVSADYLAQTESGKKLHRKFFPTQLGLFSDAMADAERAKNSR